MSIAYVNGIYRPLAQASVSVLDRGFLFADSIYEVFACYEGELFCIDEHLQRLDRSLAEIGITNPHSHQQWCELFDALLRKNAAADAALYVQVTRGADSKRGLMPQAGTQPTVVAFLCPMKSADASIQDLGVGGITLPDQRWARCDIKSVALLPNVLAQLQAAEQGAHEALLLRDGFLTEGASSNAFIVASGVVITPPNSNRLLPGITRELVLDLLDELQTPHEQRPVSEQALRNADEIWITSSTREIFPITTLDGNSVGDGKPGPLWKQAFTALQDRRKRA